MRWHHLLGLVFGIVTCTWVFSGLLSVNPGDWSPGTTPSTELQKRWLGATGVAWTSGSARAAWMAATSDGQAVREMQPVSFAGQRYWLVRSDDGSGTLVSADLRRPARVHLPERELVAQADSAMRGVERSGVDLLPVYDDYYRVTLGRTPVLPVLRMRYEDPARTWVYVDPETATLVATVPTRARVERWAYTALHDFDFALLSSQPVLRSAALVVLSLGGMLSSLAGAVLALRWLRERVTGKRSFRRR